MVDLFCKATCLASSVQLQAKQLCGNIYLGVPKASQYLTLGAHALQGYSSWVCLCVCLCPVQTVTNRPRRPMDRLSAAIAWFKTCCCFFFRKTASSRRYGIRVAAVLAILLPLAGARAYIPSPDVALDHVVFLLQALPLCLARCYIVHVRIFITGRWPRLRLPEGRYDPI